MARGIIETAKLALTVAFAIPLAFFGVDFVLKGRFLIGGLAIGAAAGMVLVEEYLTTPDDLPEAAASRVVGTVVDREPPPEESTDGPADGGGSRDSETP